MAFIVTGSEGTGTVSPSTVTVQLCVPYAMVLTGTPAGPPAVGHAPGGAVAASFAAAPGSVPAVVAPSESSTIVAARSSFGVVVVVEPSASDVRIASSDVSIASPAAVPRPG